MTAFVTALTHPSRRGKRTMVITAVVTLVDTNTSSNVGTWNWDSNDTDAGCSNNHRNRAGMNTTNGSLTNESNQQWHYDLACQLAQHLIKSKVGKVK